MDNDKIRDYDFSQTDEGKIFWKIMHNMAFSLAGTTGRFVVCGHCKKRISVNEMTLVAVVLHGTNNHQLEIE